jgi:hypothetical protein
MDSTLARLRTRRGPGSALEDLEREQYPTRGRSARSVTYVLAPDGDSTSRCPSS